MEGGTKTVGGGGTKMVGGETKTVEGGGTKTVGGGTKTEGGGGTKTKWGGTKTVGRGTKTEGGGGTKTEGGGGTKMGGLYVWLIQRRRRRRSSPVLLEMQFNLVIYWLFSPMTVQNKFPIYTHPFNKSQTKVTSPY